MAYTLEQLSKKVENLQKKLCCLITCDCDEPEEPECPQGPCNYATLNTWDEQIGGIQYNIVVSYVDPGANINAQLIHWNSTTDQTPQEFIDLLNATYNPHMTFIINPNGTIGLVAEGFAAACFLEIFISQQLPNTFATWDSPNGVQFNVIEIISSDSHSQGYYNGESWGGNQPPTTSAGYLPFNEYTEKISISYDAAIPSALTVCMHLIQNGNEITGSPFILNIPVAGTGVVDITGLTGLLDPTYDLIILIDNAC